MPDSAETRAFTLLLEMRCNNYCIFCGQREVDEALVKSRQRLGLSVPRTSFGDRRGRYTLQSATETLTRARAEGFTFLRIQGGEPTLFPQLAEVVAVARELGFTFVNVVTNGRKLKEPAFTRALIASGLDSISFSMVGADAETHDALCGVAGAFDDLLAGMRQAAAAASELGRQVHLDANVITSANNVERLFEQVRLLASLGVEAAIVHLVDFSGLADDPKVREKLEFDIRRITPALARAQEDANRLGLRLHADSVPLCLRPRLQASDVERIGLLTAVAPRRFEAAAFTYVPGKERPRLACCEPCLLRNACRRVPPEYWPDDPALAFRPINARTVGEDVDCVLAEVNPAAPKTVDELLDLERALDLLRRSFGVANELAPSIDRLRGAYADLLLLAISRHDAKFAGAAFAAHVGLGPVDRFEIGHAVQPMLEMNAAELARKTGAVPASFAPGAWRLRFDHGFELAVDGERAPSGELRVRALTPILAPVQSPVARVTRALFLGFVAGRLRDVRRLLLAPEALDGDHGRGFVRLFVPLREGAVRLEHAAGQ